MSGIDTKAIQDFLDLLDRPDKVKAAIDKMMQTGNPNL